jgi:hypothetical protein
MPRSHFVRLFVIAFVVAALSSVPAWGAPSLLSSEKLLDIFTRAWGSLTAVWAPERCNADPHGGCTPEEAPVPEPTADEGNSLDPHGNPRP